MQFWVTATSLRLNTLHLPMMSPCNSAVVKLRIDNSRRGAIHVLCDISRTKIAITSCNRSNERASFSACVGANGILLKFDLRNRQF